ncbi:E3 ubiquitin-protein ligase CCNB1IP1-like [Ctenocephalides felis]|uniref:E3 ubiquitin-protein ligase CCNB1IP1-like n=1 Tax=Ctenocephalides felis TaxID=7515 RepID=UPI000E6E1869|nr:E3 ubiquitin-protein ligase CCNB1IP1-like [Ctenocephalides felis]
MAECELYCNFRKCRKVLEYVGYMTSCSHAFCSEHGLKILKGGDPNSLRCPACNTIMIEGTDIVKTNLNPTEKYKSMILAGMKPDDALEICIRSIRFWTFQNAQELERSKHVTEHLRTRIGFLQTEFQNCERQKKHYEEQMKQVQTVLQKQKVELLEKNRMIQKLQIDLDNEKRMKRTLQNQQQSFRYDSPMHIQRSQHNLSPQDDMHHNIEDAQPFLSQHAMHIDNHRRMNDFVQVAQNNQKPFNLFDPEVGFRNNDGGNNLF